MKPFSSRIRLVPTLAVALAFVASAAALEIPYDYHVKMTPETTIFGCFSATKKPVLTIKSGATVKIDGGGAAEWGREGGEAEANAWLKANNIDATTAVSY